MIALLTTYFLVFYILIPGILFRFITSWFVPLKLFERTRTQEATFSVAVALLPFAIALFGVWYLPVMKHYPFPVTEGTFSERRQDYRRIASLLTSSDASRYLVPNPSSAPSSAPPSANEANWHALNRVLRRQARFLLWYFVAIAIEAWVFGASARRYGDWQSRAAQCRRRLWFIRTFVLPNISEWHLLLTDFNWPRREEIFVSVDILMANGYLYQGRVADYFVDSAGKLTGILLEHVSRFDRQAYLDAKNDSKSGKAIAASDFWKNIPSRHFYIGESSIANLNVRFVPKDETLISLAENILDEKRTSTYDVVVGSQDDPGYANPEQPDLYS
jgi:hypothetical protein